MKLVQLKKLVTKSILRKSEKIKGGRYSGPITNFLKIFSPLYFLPLIFFWFSGFTFSQQLFEKTKFHLLKLFQKNSFERQKCYFSLQKLCHIILYGKIDFTVHFLTFFKLAGGHLISHFFWKKKSLRVIFSQKGTLLAC